MVRKSQSNSSPTKNNTLNIFGPAGWILLGILSVTFLVYSNIFSAPFIFDDRSNITGNPDIRSLSNLKTRLFHTDKNLAFRNDPSRPVVYLTFALNYSADGLDPAGYHWVNLALHMATVVLIFLLAFRLTGFGQFERETHRLFFAAVAAAFFALHPVQTEAVTYTSHRSDSLSALFYFAALLFFINSIEDESKPVWPAGFCFVIALFSKQIAATLPATALIVDYLFVSKGNKGGLKRHWKQHLTLWAILVAYLLFRRFYIGQIGDPGFGTEKTWTHLNYAWTQPLVIVKYLKLLAMPVNQCIDHYILPLKNPLSAESLYSISIFLGTALSGWILHRRDVPFGRLMFFSVICFYICLSPTSSVLPIDDAMAERRMYLPGLGWSLFLAGIYGAMMIKLAGSKKFIAAILAVHLLLLGAATWGRNNLYRAPEQMWKNAIQLYPQNPRPYENLAVHYWSVQDFAQCALNFEKVAELKPDQASSFNNLGTIYDRMGDMDRAADSYRRSIALDSESSLSHRNLAKLYFRQKKFTESLAGFEKASSLNPNDDTLKSELETARQAAVRKPTTR